MITMLFNNPHLLHQAGSDDGVPEPAIGASTDASGLIILQQEGREILVHPGSVPDLCKLLKQLARA